MILRKQPASFLCPCCLSAVPVPEASDGRKKTSVRTVIRGDQQQAADSKRTVVDSRMEQANQGGKKKAIKGGGKGVAASELGGSIKGEGEKGKKWGMEMVAGIVQRTMGNPLRRDETRRTGPDLSVSQFGGAVQFDSLQALEQRDGLFSSFMSLTPSPCFFPSVPRPRVRHSLFHFIPRLRLPLETPGRQTQPIARRDSKEVPRTSYRVPVRPPLWIRKRQAHCWSNAWCTGGVLAGHRLMGWILGCDGSKQRRLLMSDA